MEIQLEQTILRNLLTNDEYARKVAAFLSPDYFEGVYKALFKEFTKFISKYNKLPTIEAFKIEIDQGDRLNDEQYRHAIEILPNIFTPEAENLEWLVDRTEKWCQDRAVYNAIMESIQVIDGKHQTLSKNAIPDILSKALSVTFDTNIGHDYIENMDSRFDFYHEKEERIPFDLDYFNRITKGGLPNKTLNIALAGTGVGKSLFMCHCAGASLSQGKNVLYITMEMAEERIAERIDANLLNVPIDQLENLSKDMFTQRVTDLAKKTSGKLIIKEYPTGQANASHFRALLNELKLKKNFVPNLIFIDYLNICASSRMKAMGGSINSYSYIKSIAEELRGLAVEFNVPIVSATQTTRSGFCLDLNTLVRTPNGNKTISEIVVGDKVLSNDGWNTVRTVFPITTKKMYRITTKSGKQIICSEDHLFPTENGEKNIKGGLCLEDKLFINTSGMTGRHKE